MQTILLSLLCISVSGLTIGRAVHKLGRNDEQSPTFPGQFTKITTENNAVHNSMTGSNFVGISPVTHTLEESTPVPMGVWMANGAGALVTLACLAYMKLADEKSALLGLASIVCYITLSCLVDINISVAGNGQGVKFEPAVSVFIVEVGKLLASVMLYIVNRLPVMRDGESFIQEGLCMRDIMFLSLPGGLFALNNILIYVSIGFNDMASFGVFRDTVIFFNAALWCWVFKSELGMTRILTLGGVFMGLCLNQVGPLLTASLSLSVLLVLAMTLTNACASVANEYAIKQNSGLDLNLQNAILYSFCSVFAIVYIIVLKPHTLSSFDTFFANFDKVAWLLVVIQLSVGLLVSRILKYADAVTKAVGSCLRGPIVVFLAPLIGLHSRMDMLTGLSAVIVATSACYFLMQGRPAPGIDVDNKVAK